MCLDPCLIIIFCVWVQTSKFSKQFYGRFEKQLEFLFVQRLVSINIIDIEDELNLFCGV